MFGRTRCWLSQLMMQNDPCGVSFSSSRSRWNTKCKRDAAAPPIWLRRVLNDATNLDDGGSGNNDSQPQSHQNDTYLPCPSHDRAAFDASRDMQQWRQQPVEGTRSVLEDASDLYLNPHAFDGHDSRSHQLQTGSVVPLVSQGGGSYASIHAAVAGAGCRTVQSARRTRVSSPPPPPLPLSFFPFGLFLWHCCQNPSVNL